MMSFTLPSPEQCGADCSPRLPGPTTAPSRAARDSGFCATQSPSSSWQFCPQCPQASDSHVSTCGSVLVLSVPRRYSHRTWWINPSPPANPFHTVFFISEQSGQAISPRNEAPSYFCCWHFPRLARDMTLLPHQPCLALKRKRAARGKRATRMPSILDGFCRLPEPPFAAESVGPLAVSGEDAQSGKRLATIAGVPASTGQAEPSPRGGVRARPRHVGRSVELAQ
jgi:hypothetical protein